MKRFYLVLVVLLLSITAMGQDLKIARLNTPTVNIDGKECKVGDIFTKTSKVNWKDSKQVIIAKDSSGKLLRMSAAAAEGKSGYTVEKLLGLQKSYKHLSTRSIEDEIEVSGEYILEDQVTIPTGMEPDDSYTIEIIYNYDGETISYTPEMTKDKTAVIVNRSIYKGKAPKQIKVKMMCTPEGDSEFCISEEIEIVPLEKSFDEE